MTGPDEFTLSAEELKQHNENLRFCIARLEERLRELKLRANNNLSRLQTIESKSASEVDSAATSNATGAALLLSDKENPLIQT